MRDVALADPSAEWWVETPRSIRRHAVAGLTLMALAFGGFGWWAFTAPLAAAVIAQGSFVATGRNSIVQHLEGGIIERIYIREGQTVEKGDELLVLDPISAEATERELHLRELRLTAISERLLAEYRGSDDLAFSPPLREAAARDVEVAAILDGQELAFDVARQSLLEDVALLERDIEALKIRERGYAAQFAAFELRAEILAEDIEAKGALLVQGLVRKTEVNALRRMEAESQGQIARLRAEIDEVRQMLLKHESRIERARAAYREAALDELGPIAAELESVREKRRQARSVLNRSVVRAPVSGTVVRMHYHTLKGVVEPGAPIAEILPADAPLIIEAQIQRTEIDALSQGQIATVRLIALNQRTTPVLSGEVFYISADSIPETVGGHAQEVYLARVSIAAEELARVPGFAPTPGMPVEVMIQTGERTFADYLAKPITDSFSRAFREQ